MSRRLPVRIPQSVEEIDAAWLTHAVRSAGLLDAANVVGFRTGSPGSGVGFQGQTIRVSLDWDTEEPDAPDAVLVKFPTDNAGNRGLAEAEGAYDREFDFYERLSDDFPVRVPRLIHAVRDPGPLLATRRRRERFVDGLPAPVVKFIGRHARKLVRPTKRRYALVMEYIPDARTTTAMDLPPAEDLSTILGTLAEMHAHFWGDLRLADDSVFEWSMLTQMPNVMHGLYRAWRDDVVEREPGVFTDELMRHADWVGDHIVGLAAHLNQPLSIRHGDCRTDNMLFTDAGLVMIDFGVTGSGRPAGDVAYLLSETIPPGPEARATFLRLCREYHDRLVAAGGTDHPLDEFLNDCDIVLAVQAYRVVLIEAAFEADYEGESLSHLWGPRVRSLLADGLPRF